MITVALTILAFVSAPIRSVQRDFVDRVEDNTMYERDGQTESFRQLIFWNWKAREGRWEVVAWCKVDKHTHSWPVVGGRLFQFRSRSGRRHEVFTGQVITTRTNYDPEIRDRDITPQKMRRGLWGLK